MTACLDAIEIIVEKPKEPPKLYLNLSASREIIIKAGNKLAVDIPISKDLAKRDGKQKFDDSDGKRIQVRFDLITFIEIIDYKSKSNILLYCSKIAGKPNYWSFLTSWIKTQLVAIKYGIFSIIDCLIIKAFM